MAVLEPLGGIPSFKALHILILGELPTPSPRPSVRMALAVGGQLNPAYAWDKTLESGMPILPADHVLEAILVNAAPLSTQSLQLKRYTQHKVVA